MWFLLLFILSSSVIAKCPLKGGLTGKIKIETQWSAAESICQYLGGHLASIHSQAQNDWLLNFTETHSVRQPVYVAFLGGFHENGKWQYTDGTKMDFFNFQWEKIPNTGNPPIVFGKVPVSMTTNNAHWEYNGYWNADKDTNYDTTNFICQVPRCGANGAAPASILDPKRTDTALVHGDLTNALYYGTKYDILNRSKLSETMCNTVGAHLPSVQNAFENSQLQGIAKIHGLNEPFDFNFGYFVDANGSSWSWTDGSNVTSYTNWKGQQPPGKANSYSIFSSTTGHWELDTNQTRGYYVCEFREVYRANYC